MNTPQKTNALQSYQVLLYDRALHPELFPLKGRRVARPGGAGAWELEAWVMQGQHLVRFERGAICASELVTDQDSGLPTSGAVAAFLCAGERDFEHAFKPSRSANGRHGAVRGNGPANGLGNIQSVIRGSGRSEPAACPKDGVLYMTTVQTESLSENLYIATCEEMTGHCRENGSLLHVWDEESGRGMSIVDIQKFASEVHVQAYHLLPAGGIVIRTQSIFEHG